MLKPRLEDDLAEEPNLTGYVVQAFRKSKREYLSPRELTIQTRILIPGNNLNAAKQAVNDAEKKGLIRMTSVTEDYELVKSS